MLHRPAFLIAVGAILVAGYLTALLWRRRSLHAVKPLLGFAAVVVLYLVVHTTLYVPGPARSSFAAATGRTFEFGPHFQLLSLLTGIGGTLWFVFALQYTGRGERMARSVVGVLAAFWMVVLTVAAWGQLTGAELSGQPLTDQVLSFGLFTALALLIIGIFLVVETGSERNAVGTPEAMLLGVGATVFSVITGVTGFLSTEPAIPPAMFVVTCLLFVVAIRRYPIFETLPVARVAGRDRVIAEMDNAILVVDERNRVRDLNRAASSTFGCEREAALGAPIDEVLSEPLDAAEIATLDGGVQLQAADGTVLTVTADRVTDAKGRSFGHVLQCSDVTERRRRERRLGVLHQFLTGAVEQRLVAVADDADRLRTQLDDGDADEAEPVAFGRGVSGTVAPLKQVVARTRAIEDALATLDTEQVAAQEVLGSLETEVVDSVDCPESVTVTTDPTVLVPTLALLLSRFEQQGDTENHDGIAVSVTVEGGDGSVITIEGSGQTPDGDASPIAPDDLAVDVARLAIESLDGTLSIIDGARRPIRIRLPAGGGST